MVVEPGTFLVLLGPSGSGKSTLVRCVNRLVPPTDGRVYVDGEDVVAMRPEALRHLRRHKVSMVFQQFALLPHRTVLDNAALRLSGLPLLPTWEDGLQRLVRALGASAGTGVGKAPQ